MKKDKMGRTANECMDDGGFCLDDWGRGIMEVQILKKYARRVWNHSEVKCSSRCYLAGVSSTLTVPTHRKSFLLGIQKVFWYNRIAYPMA